MSNRRLMVPLMFAGLAAAAGVAAADSSSYWRQNGLMLEVSADPRDGVDFVRVDATRANQLELIALNDMVTLRGITLHFADGRAMSQRVSFVRPGQPLLVDLPQHCAPITSVDLDYGDPALRRQDRTEARLQIVPRMESRYEQPQVGYYEHHYDQPTYTQGYTRPAYSSYQPAYSQPTYSQPAYSQPTYQAPSPAYYNRTVRTSRYTVKRPRASQWQMRGSVGGSIRF